MRPGQLIIFALFLSICCSCAVIRQVKDSSSNNSAICLVDHSVYIESEVLNDSLLWFQIGMDLNDPVIFDSAYFVGVDYCEVLLDGVLLGESSKEYPSHRFSSECLNAGRHSIEVTFHECLDGRQKMFFVMMCDGVEEYYFVYPVDLIYSRENNRISIANAADGVDIFFDIDLPEDFEVDVLFDDSVYSKSFKRSEDLLLQLPVLDPGEYKCIIRGLENVISNPVEFSFVVDSCG